MAQSAGKKERKKERKKHSEGAQGDQRALADEIREKKRVCVCVWARVANNVYVHVCVCVKVRERDKGRWTNGAKRSKRTRASVPSSSPADAKSAGGTSRCPWLPSAQPMAGARRMTALHWPRKGRERQRERESQRMKNNKLISRR